MIPERRYESISIPRAQGDDDGQAELQQPASGVAVTTAAAALPPAVQRHSHQPLLLKSLSTAIWWERLLALTSEVAWWLLWLPCPFQHSLSSVTHQLTMAMLLGATYC